MTTATNCQNCKFRGSTREVSLLADQFVDMAFITAYTGLTDKWFYKLIRDGEFPAPVKFGRSSRWLKSELETWVQMRMAKTRF